MAVIGGVVRQPPPRSGDLRRLADGDYQQACAAGQIGPPVIDLNPGQPTCQDWNVYVFVDACQQGRIGPPVEE